MLPDQKSHFNLKGRIDHTPSNILVLQTNKTKTTCCNFCAVFLLTSFSERSAEKISESLTNIHEEHSHHVAHGGREEDKGSNIWPRFILGSGLHLSWQSRRWNTTRQLNSHCKTYRKPSCVLCFVLKQENCAL